MFRVRAHCDERGQGEAALAATDRFQGQAAGPQTMRVHVRVLIACAEAHYLPCCRAYCTAGRAHAYMIVFL